MTGATGLVGKNLGLELTKQGHQILVITRKKESAIRGCPFPCEIIEADLVKGKIDSDQLLGIEAVFNLMGEPIASGQWTETKKQKLISSRVQSTENLIKSFKNNMPKNFISASAIGYYGDRKDEILTEDSVSGDDFLAKLCQDWEKAALKIKSPQTRVVAIRTGIVLSKEGGALSEMLPAFRAGVGGRLGNGEQWMSWIHLQDLIRIYIQALNNENIFGPVNGVAPSPVKNKEFTRTLSKVIHRPAFMSVPKIALKAIFGEKSVILTSSQKVLPEKLFNLSFAFKYSDLGSALRA